MKYRPIGLPLRSRPRRCSSVASSSSAALGSCFAATASRDGSSGSAARFAGSLRRPVGLVADRDPTVDEPRRRRRFPSPDRRRRRRAPARCRPRRRRRRDRHRVTDTWLANQRPLGCLGRRSAFLHRLGKLDVVAIVDLAVTPASPVSSTVAAWPLPRRRCPPREPRRRFELDGVEEGSDDELDVASGEAPATSAGDSVGRSESV